MPVRTICPLNDLPISCTGSYVVTLPNCLMSVIPVSARILAISSAFFCAEPLPSPCHLSVVPCERICAVRYCVAASLSSLSASDTCAPVTLPAFIAALMAAASASGLALNQPRISALEATGAA